MGMKNDYRNVFSFDGFSALSGPLGFILIYLATPGLPEQVVLKLAVSNIVPAKVTSNWQTHSLQTQDKILYRPILSVKYNSLVSIQITSTSCQHSLLIYAPSCRSQKLAEGTF